MPGRCQGDTMENTEDKIRESMDFRQTVFLHINRVCANAFELDKYQINIENLGDLLSTYFDTPYQTSIAEVNIKYEEWKETKKKYSVDVLKHREDSLQDKELIWRKGESDKFRLLIELCARKNLLPLEGTAYILGEEGKENVV